MSKSAGARGHLYYDVEARVAGHDVRVLLAGCVDEHADLEQVRARIGEADAILDLASIDAINSAGISKWIGFLEQLTRSPGRRITLVRCSFQIVVQAAMITNMTAGAIVESVLAPYVCGCDEEQAREVRGWTDLEETRECDECSCPLVLDASPEIFSPIFGPRA